MKPVSISKAEMEWVNGPDRRVVVHARKLKDERKRLLFLCGFFNPHRSLLSNASILKAADIVERYADGLVSGDHFARAVGIISVYD